MFEIKDLHNQIAVLPFLSKRKYLQGGTLFEFLLSYYQEAQDITLKLNQMIFSNHILLIDYEAAFSSKLKPHATLSFMLSNRFKKIGVIPRASIEPIEYVQFDERCIVASAQFYHNLVVANEPRGNSFIKSVIALNKELLRRNFLSKNQNSKAIFTRIDLQILPKTYSSLQIQLQLDRIHSLFSISKIFIDESYVGDVYFSWVEKNE